MFNVCLILLCDFVIFEKIIFEVLLFVVSICFNLFCDMILKLDLSFVIMFNRVMLEFDFMVK